jgi:hypothetical protein
MRAFGDEQVARKTPALPGARNDRVAPRALTGLDDSWTVSRRTRPKLRVA